MLIVTNTFVILSSEFIIKYIVISIVIIEIEYLDIDEANDLSKHLGFNKKYKAETKLVDVIKKNNIKNYKKIGLE